MPFGHVPTMHGPLGLIWAMCSPTLSRSATAQKLSRQSNCMDMFKGCLIYGVLSGPYLDNFCPMFF